MHAPTHTHKQIFGVGTFGAANERGRNILLNWLFVWSVIYYLYYQFSDMATLKPRKHTKRVLSGWCSFDLPYVGFISHSIALWISAVSSHISPHTSSFPLFTPSLSLSPCLSIVHPLSHSLCPLWQPLSPPALPLSSPSVRLLQTVLLPPCPPHVLPLEDMHPGSRCTLLCVLINILAASRRKWVFLQANPLWSGCLEQRNGRMMEEGGRAPLFIFLVS